MTSLKVWWHCRKNKGHRMTSYRNALGFLSYYCETCRYGLNDYTGDETK